MLNVSLADCQHAVKQFCYNNSMALKLTKDEQEISDFIVETIRKKRHVVAVFSDDKGLVSLSGMPKEDAVLFINRLVWRIDE